MSSNNLSILNDKQREACEAVNGPSLIIAGAGSGKTRVLTYRIAYLIHDVGVHPTSILAITFTNKAAKEMRDRLSNLVGEEAKWITAQTFHSFCAAFLRKEIVVLERSKRFTIIDDDESETMIKNIMKDLNYDIKAIKPSVYYNAISSIKSRMATIKDYQGFLGDRLENVMTLYNAQLEKENLVDFDDLILLTMRILEKNPDILDKYQNIYRYILVDEFQDTSNIQYDLIKLLGSKYQNVFIVGDEDQSIYSFRGANINNIRKFMKDFPSYSKFVLDQNYRSTSTILDCANKLISKNEDRIPKDLWTDNKGGEDVKLLRSYSDKQEAREVISEIERLVEYKGYNYKDIAILYRNNFLSRNFENELILRHIPYKIYSGLSFYKRKEVKDLIAYLRLVLDPEDLYSFKKVINFPKRGVGDSSIEKIQTAVDKYKLTIKEATLNAGVSKSVIATVESFYTMIDRLREEMKILTLSIFLSHVYKNTGYLDYIESLDDDEAESRDENVKELFNAISETQSLSIEETLTDYLDNVTLMTDLDTETKDENHVSLMTMHTAKGLEFNAVFAVGLEDGILPSLRSYTKQEKEEERRLFYVAMTRARERLYLSCADSRFRNGLTESCKPSMFLEDIILKSAIKRNDARFPEPPKMQGTIPVSKPKVKKGEYNIGDRVVHMVFGKGTIKAEVEGFYIIQFDDVKQPKKVIVDHPLLKKDN